MDSGELVGCPDGEDNQKDEAGEIDGATAAETGGTADKDHGDVSDPHGKRQEDLGIAEVGGAEVLLCDDRADEQARGHAGQPEEEGFERDLIDGFKRSIECRKPARGRCFVLEAVFLNEVEERCDEGDEEGGVGGEEEDDVEEYPAGAYGDGEVLVAGAEGGEHAEEEDDGEDEDADGYAAIAGVDAEEDKGEDEGEEGEDLVGFDGQAMVGCVEGFGEGDEVEEGGGDGGGDGYLAPGVAVVEGGGQDRERGYAVEENRDSKPKEGHWANMQYIRRLWLPRLNGYLSQV